MISLQEESMEAGTIRRQLEARVERRRSEVHSLSCLLEQAMHLLWAHLDLYLRRNLPQPGHSLNGESTSEGSQDSLHELRVHDDSEKGQYFYMFHVM